MSHPVRYGYADGEADGYPADGQEAYADGNGADAYRGSAAAEPAQSYQTNYRLTPDQVRSMRFSRTPLGRRGINEDELRSALGRIAEDMASSDAEKAALRAEVSRLRDYFRRHHPEAKVAEPDNRPRAEAVNILSQAQQQADAYVASALEYGRQVTAQARHQAEELLRDAQRRAEAAAETAAHEYRRQAGNQYASQIEELERRVAWLKTFAKAVQVQMKSATEAFSQEIAKVTDAPLTNGATDGAFDVDPTRTVPTLEPEAVGSASAVSLDPAVARPESSPAVR